MTQINFSFSIVWISDSNMTVKAENLDFWIENNLNVMFIGKHGVGKTSLVKEAFDQHNLNWKYFSASTMDPWVDLIGVPKEKFDDDGNSYLDLVRPKEFQYDQVEALFFDEFNRSHKKIRNAVMELIQFKSINGFKFNNLKIVWAAINPPDDDDNSYDVEVLDPAQEDRFHVYCHIPYAPSMAFFTQKFGKGTAKAVISWWKELGKDIQNKVSPRRLEHATDIYLKGGDIRYVLPQSSNVSKLITIINHGPITDKLDELYNKEDNVQEIIDFLQVENNFASAISYILNNTKYLRCFLPYMPKEKISNLLIKEPVLLLVLEQADKHPIFKEVIDEVLKANVNKSLTKKIKTKVIEFGITSLLPEVQISNSLGKNPAKAYYSNSSATIFSTRLAEAATIANSKIFNTYERRQVHAIIADSIPKQLSTVQAIQALGLLFKVAKKSHKNTILGMKNFLGVVRHCVETISVNENITNHAKMVSKYVEVRSIYSRLDHLTLGDRLYIVGSGQK